MSLQGHIRAPCLTGLLASTLPLKNFLASNRLELEQRKSIWSDAPLGYSSPPSPKQGQVFQFVLPEHSVMFQTSAFLVLYRYRYTSVHLYTYIQVPVHIHMHTYAYSHTGICEMLKEKRKSTLFSIKEQAAISAIKITTIVPNNHLQRGQQGVRAGLSCFPAIFLSQLFAASFLPFSFAQCIFCWHLVGSNWWPCMEVVVAHSQQHLLIVLQWKGQQP